MRDNTRNGDRGGHLVGMKECMCEKCRLEDWFYGMVMKVDRRHGAKELWITEVYNNVGFKEI